MIYKPVKFIISLFVKVNYPFRIHSFQWLMISTDLQCNKAKFYWHYSILWIWMAFADMTLHFFEQQMHYTLFPVCILISLAFLYIWYFPTLVNNDDSKFSLIYIHILYNIEERKTTHITFHWIPPSLNVMYVNVQLDRAGGYSRVTYLPLQYVRLIGIDDFEVLWQ